MSRSQAGVRRGAAAAGQFTQIANALFRDPRVSFRAKGIFGYVSTHRIGWQVTVDDLVRLGPDGRDAVRAGLWELEAHGYLIRERLRRPDGTLATMVYCITDRPAAVDLALIEAGLGTQAFDTVSGGSVGSGVRRGVMAADQFTQVANALFRDARLSFKAKGLFGLLSTHRDGWRMTVTGLARRGREGESAVKSGLKELEKHGFLVRERERGPRGTLGAAAYLITELPALQNPRSQPESGFPPVDAPMLADRPRKNTNRKNTTQQNTSPLRPCERGNAARTISGTPDPDAAAPVPSADELHPGIRLLLEIAASHPELLLTGKALTDQGRICTVMMEAGWSREQLQHVITGRPLPQPVRTSVGAVVAARLRAAQAYPPPATVAHHAAPAGEDPPERATGSVAARTVSEALTYRALVECAGCGVPATAPGEALCPACLGWPPCRTCPGPTPRRAHPDSDGHCTTCASAFTHDPQASLR